MWSKRTRRYTRCRLHGGASTGPRTAEGRQRCQRANWRNGKYSVAAKAHRRAELFFIRQDRLELQWLWRQFRLLEKLERLAEKRKKHSIAVFVMGLGEEGKFF
jgi:hypothetical protein